MFLLRCLPALGLAFFSACSNRLDTRPIEADIQAAIERQGRRLTLEAVRCPTNILRQAEASFRCVGELDPEGTFAINVVQQDSQGNVTWEVPNSSALLNLVTVEDEIQTGLAAAFGQRPDVNCGSELYRPNQPGDQFECQVIGGLTVENDRIHSVLVKVGVDGNLQWQEQRQPLVNPAPSPSTPPASTAAPPVPSTAPPAEN